MRDIRELKYMQSLPLERKIEMTAERINITSMLISLRNGREIRRNKMREILFRAKRTTKNEFAYGSLYVCGRKDGKCEIENYNRDMNIERFAYAVIPETVGQYTGLTDKNGKKIFEGDIVHLYGDEHSLSRYKGIDYNALVIFKDGGFCAIDGTEDDYAVRRYNFVSQNLYCEVIGNIYDNPELLKDGYDE